MFVYASRAEWRDVSTASRLNGSLTSLEMTGPSLLESQSLMYCSSLGIHQPDCFLPDLSFIRFFGRRKNSECFCRAVFYVLHGAGPEMMERPRLLLRAQVRSAAENAAHGCRVTSQPIWKLLLLAIATD
jgi:hypothetical protein